MGSGAQYALLAGITSRRELHASNLAILVVLLLMEAQDWIPQWLLGNLTVQGANLN